LSLYSPLYYYTDPDPDHDPDHDPDLNPDLDLDPDHDPDLNPDPDLYFCFLPLFIGLPVHNFQ
jgi:hypothetical protein